MNDPRSQHVGASFNSLEQVQAVYAQERDRRINADGMKQYLDPKDSEQFRSLLEDPWIEPGTPINSPIIDGEHCKIVIIGAGFGGILNAVQLIKAGFDVNDILIVDPAGGFGGTWYFNRYPGLMCDVESYIYLPLLEDMGYIPTQKYVGGEEIRKYAERIAEKYDLHRRAMFQSSGKRAVWNPERKEWDLQLSQCAKGSSERSLSIRASFVIFASGVLNHPKLSDIPGIELFEGQMFHTARWAYDITGGSPTEPELTKLKGKRVGFIGTGATGVQVVPQLAKWSKELYIFQRTPSSVDVRNNRDTDLATWKTAIATKPGWQRERAQNFDAFISSGGPRPEVNLVDDAWTDLRSHSTLTGAPITVTMEDVGEYVTKLHENDLVRSEKIRQRAAETVKDPATAKLLQAWYPSWCKRPCFHDEYLPTFNAPNVTLLDTSSKSIEKITSKGIVLNGKEYELDVLIWGTGYISPGVGSSAGKAGVEVIGEDGTSLDTVFSDGRLNTLHSVISRGFPNMFWTSHVQGGSKSLPSAENMHLLMSLVSGNYTNTLNTASTHIAYILAEASRRSGPKPVIQPTQEGEDRWGMSILQGGLTFAGLAGCTPGYINLESEVDRMKPEQQMTMARYGVWPRGSNDFISVLESWRKDGRLEGLEIVASA